MAADLANSTLEEDLEKHSRDGRLGSLFDEQKQMLAELRDYMSNARKAGGKQSGVEREDDRTSGSDASFAKAEGERSPEEKYPEFSEEEHSIRLSVCVNLVLIGSQGEDDNLLSVPHDTLELWLENLMSVVRHATTLGGPTPSGVGSTRSSSEETPGVVEYVYRFRVVDVARKVRDALEAHMRAFLREDVEGPGSSRSAEEQKKDTNGKMKKWKRMFMPSWRMEEFLGSLATELAASAEGKGGRATGEGRLPVVAYTFFVLNPRRSWISPAGADAAVAGGGGYDWAYGYRCALSPSVMEVLAADPEVVQRAEEMERAEQIRWRVVHGVDRTASGMDDFDLRDELLDYGPPAGEQGRISRLERADRTENSHQWAVERMVSLPIKTGDEAEGAFPRSWDISEEKALLLQGNIDAPPEDRARTILRDVLEVRRGGRDRGQDAAGGGSGAIGSSCLTESWVSGKRFAWVDLQAGPFDWGPASGGEGFKSASSLTAGLLRLDRGGSSSSPAEAGVSRGRGGTRDDTVSVSLDGLRGRLSARIGRLAALEKKMACGDGVVSEQEASDGGGGPPRSRQRLGVVAVACEEISSQLEFLRRFQAREKEVISAADAAAAERGGSAMGGGQEAGDAAEGFADVLRTLRRFHGSIFEEVLGELAPATESDSSRGATAGKLGVESQALLARLAAMVSSLARTVITPPSALSLPLLPPSTTKNKTTTNDALGLGDETRLPFQGHSDRQASSSLQTLLQYRFPTGPSLALRARNGGMDKTAAAAAVSAGGGHHARGHHASSLHPLLSPPSPPSALEFFVPEDLAFTLYVVRAQDVYPPLGTPPPPGRKDRRGGFGRGDSADDSELKSEAGAAGSLGFDLPAFQAGAMSLKLPNQQASFTVHQVTASGDPVFATALAGATGVSLVNAVTPRGEPRVERRVSIDSAKIRHQLRARVEGGEDPEHGGKEGAAAAEQARRYTRHITIFLFSMAGPESVYVDELWRARGVGGDMVVVAQSERRRDGAPPLTCGGRAVEEDPRNPLRQALAALGSTVGGLVPSQYSWHEAKGGRVILDWRWSMSESPMSPLVPHAQFSQLDQDVIYRTHVVRALSASAQLTRAGSSVLLEALSRETSRKILEGSLSDSLLKTRASLRDISSFRVELMKKVDIMEFDYVVKKLNPLLDMSRKFYEDASRLESEVMATSRRLAGLDAITTAGAGTPSIAGAQIDASSGLLLLALAVSGAVVAVWLLRRMGLLSFSRSRHRKKHVKVN